MLPSGLTPANRGATPRPGEWSLDAGIPEARKAGPPNSPLGHAAGLGGYHPPVKQSTPIYAISRRRSRTCSGRVGFLPL